MRSSEPPLSVRPVICAFQVRAQAAAILGAADPPRMVERFLALLWGDLLVSRLLAAVSAPTAAEIERRARDERRRFLILIPAGKLIAAVDHAVTPKARWL